MKYIAALILSAFFIFPTPCLADNYSTPLVTMYPLAGAYFDPDTSGSGWFISVGLKGELFAAHFTYQPDGSQTWVVLDDAFVPTPDPERLATGIIGRVTGQLFQGTNGQFVGGPKRAAEITSSPLGQATLTWRNTDRGEFTYNGITSRLIRYHDFQATSTPQKEVMGTWRWHKIRAIPQVNAFYGEESDAGSVVITPVTSGRKYFYYDRAAPTLFPVDDASTAEQYQMRCSQKTIQSTCPFGGQIHSTGDDNALASDAIVVRYGDGHFQVVTYAPTVTRQDIVDGRPITRYFVSANDQKIDLYFVSPQAKQLASRFSTNTAGSASIVNEVVLDRIADGVIPLE